MKSHEDICVPGLVLERPTKLKDNRTYLIAYNDETGFHFERATFHDGIVPYWYVNKLWGVMSIVHNNHVEPYKIPNAKEYLEQVDHFLGF